MRDDLADHLAEHQLGQEAAPAAPPRDDQIGAALARLGNDLLERLVAAAHAQRQRDAGPLRLGFHGVGARTGLGVGARRQRRHLRFVLGVADQRHDAGQRQATTRRQREGDGLGATVELRVLGGEQQPLERMRHRQCPTSQPVAAAATTTAPATLIAT
jgi:hypothetical protein